MKRVSRIALWIIVPLASLFLIAAAGGFALFHKFYPSVPAADFPPASDAATAQRQDFHYFRNYLELNRSYTPEARTRAASLLAKYEAQSEPLSTAQFDLAIARMAALADNGHSRVHPGPLSRRHTRLPCRLYLFDDGYRVLRARPACIELLGAKVVSVEGRPIEEVADRMFEYVGGPRNHYDQFAAPFYIESPELLQAAGLAAGPDRLTLHVVKPDGSEQDAEIIADPPNPKAPRLFGNEYLSPQPIEDEPADWKAFLPVNAALPPFLRDFDNPFLAEYWADKGTYYAQFRSNEDEPGHPIGEFIKRVRQEIVADHPRRIIVDLRFDQGGNFTKTAALMKNITTLSESIKHVYILTGAWTFSAGDVSVALARAHGGGKVTVVGEPVGDRIRLWAEGGSLELPNSKLSIGFATGLHDYSHSCAGEPGCFWIMYFYPMHVPTLDPDVRVGYSFADYAALRDPVLERVLGATTP